MTREDIIRMAREAGFVGMDGDHGALRRFAAIAHAAGAAAEREACAKLAETYREWDDTGMGIAAAIRERSANAGARGQV